jgi:hypothetical protein
VITTAFSAALRQTGSGSGTATVTQTGVLASATTTSGNGTAISTTSGGGGLSPGAIAGIVIGVLAAIVILILLCACCILRGLWHGLLSLLGLRKKKEKRHSRETIIEEEEIRRTGSVHSRRDRHSGWYAGGGRPGTVASRRTEKRRESNSGNGWLGLGAAGATLLVLLGLRRDKKRKQNEKVRSNVSSAYYSDSYTASSPSKLHFPGTAVGLTND